MQCARIHTYTHTRNTHTHTSAHTCTYTSPNLQRVGGLWVRGLQEAVQMDLLPRGLNIVDMGGGRRSKRDLWEAGRERTWFWKGAGMTVRVWIHLALRWVVCVFV